MLTRIWRNLELLDSAGGNVKFSGYKPKRNESTNSVICTLMLIETLFTIAKKWKQTNYPLRQMDEQNVVCIYNEILFCLKNEGNSDKCYNMNEP